jgi:hypothetical protein
LSHGAIVTHPFRGDSSRNQRSSPH